MRRFGVAGALVLVAAIGWGASEGTAAPAPTGLQSEASWDWDKGEFQLTLRMPLPTDTEATPPKRRYLAEQAAERVLPQEFVRRAAALPVASGKTLGEVMGADPTVEAGVTQLGSQLKFVSSRVDEAYTTLEMVWSVNLWQGFGPLLRDAPEANDVPTRLQWAASRDFSGLVIFAMGDLPWKGTNLKARWEPSMTFRLLNPKGEVIFDPSMSAPDLALKWGQAAVSLGKFSEDKWRDRIGNDPLRIVARGVWGARPGDLVLAEGDWDRILSRAANRQLLAEGRMLVLYGPFPDYTDKPNPDSAIDEEKPAVETIPEPPVETTPAPAKTGE